MDTDQTYIKWLADLDSNDTILVGGKNASLGEMIGALKEEGIRVPDGFASTADAYWAFLDENDLRSKIDNYLGDLKSDHSNLDDIGRKIRRAINRGSFPDPLRSAIVDFYHNLSRRHGVDELAVAVRSSATAEDLPEASFAGQQETFLNISGDDDVLTACRRCFASLFTDRAISYREEKGFDHTKIALSAGVQTMVRADKGGAGVMFSIDPESGFRDVIVINAAWGLGENVVQGNINPDEYVVFKPLLETDSLRPIIDKTIGSKEKKMIYARGGSHTTRNIDASKKEQSRAVLSDDDILHLARWGSAIETHYGKPMDIEWAKDGSSGDLYIVQARPETVQSQKALNTLSSYQLTETGNQLVAGLAIGQGIATGKVQVILKADDIDRFEDDAILVTSMTDPDWVPIMKRASGIVTDLGGRTSHAAIVSRELGIPAVVGTEDGTEELSDGQEVTVSCAEGERGVVYKGILKFKRSEVNLDDVPEIETSIRMNIASPAAAFRWWRLPCDGIGLARMEFIINNVIKIHPLALLRYDDLEDADARRMIRRMTSGYDDRSAYFVDHLSRGIARIAASQYPHQVLVRMSDFKTNEYADLIGGAQFESSEENPMLGYRGASRYYSEKFREAFGLECRAIKRAREEIGLNNVAVMIPFCRTLDEADKVLRVLADFGLVRGENGLQVWVMCEIPSNVILAEQFAERFDGFSIGSNDLTQLILGVDRDSAALSELFDERDNAVKQSIADLIQRAHAVNTPVSICGQAPSDYPSFAEFLVANGIDSISLNPDSVIDMIHHIAATESQR